MAQFKFSLAFGLLVIVQPTVPLWAADSPWDWAIHCSRQSDFDTLHPQIQQMLRNDAAGTVRNWRSRDGRHGRITLVSGGDKAGSADAVVRITIMAGRREQPFFTFRYRKDAQRGWAVCG